MSRRVGSFLVLVLALAVLVVRGLESDEGAPRGPKSRGEPPSPFRARGRLVCLAEEMARLYRAEIDPVHPHLVGFRVEAATDDAAAGKLRYLTILRTAQSEALFADERFSNHVLVLSGRTFPGTALLEVSGWRWIRDGKLFDIYYWCEICSIRGIQPGSCACCQQEVELREVLVEPETQETGAGGAARAGPDRTD